MVRSFPGSTPLPTRLKLTAACATLLIGVSAVAPQATADDKLRDRQRQVQGQVRGAQGDLEESSKALASAARGLTRARAALGAAQRRLTVAQRNLDAAARVDALMQARLQAAEQRLAGARTALDEARARVVSQRAAIGQLAASNYANGDPSLMGLSVMLNSQNPEEVTSQMNTVDSLMSRQTTLLDDLKQARARMVAEEARVEKAEAGRGRPARGRARQPGEAAVARERRRRRPQRGGHPRRPDAGRAGRGRPRAPGRPGPAARAEEAGEPDPPDDHRAGAPPEGWLPRRLRRVPGAARPGGGHLVLRLARHPIYGYWGLHDGTDFHAPCGTPERAAGAGTVISRPGPTSTATGSTSTSARSTART